MRVTQAFQERYGTAPAGLWHAPDTVTLIGDHAGDDGLTLSCAVPWGVSAAVGPRQDGAIRLTWLREPSVTQMVEQPEHAHGWARHLVGVMWAMRRQGLAIPGADIMIDDNVPPGGGAVPGTALGLAVALALDEVYGLGLERMELARIGLRSQTELASAPELAGAPELASAPGLVGAPSEIIGHATAALAREGHALLFDLRSEASRSIPFDLAGRGHRVLIIEIGREGAPPGLLADRRRECVDAAKRLGMSTLRDVTDLAGALGRLTGAERDRTQHVVTENHRVEAVAGLLRAGAVPEIGAVLNASHLSLRDQFQVSHPRADAAVLAAVRGGARGARMSGASRVIALTAEERVEQVAATVRQAYQEQDWATPAMFSVTAAAGAHQIRPM